jgi:EAL domain-containing protein (putative c-di-GMP-specific phosphodiesterase class I)
MLNANATQPCAVLAIKLDGWEGLTALRSMRQRDELEAAIERSLHHSLVAAESIARAGANLYVILLLGVASKADASAAFARICRTFETSAILPMRSPNVQLVAGIALRSRIDTEPEQLLEAAELALRHVNRNICPSPHFYHPGLGESWRQQIAYEDALASAVRNDELRLHFQPQVACEGGSTLAIEALVRWQHPLHGMIPPAQFIPLAEASGHIDQIGAWVIEQGIRQLRVIQGQSGLALRLAINVSPQQLLSRELERHLADCLQRYGVAACEIELEVTESVAMEMPDVVISHLQRLRNLGFRLSIDDFGTGYSSLSYLQHLPVHALKLDRSFIRNLTDDPKALSICRNTIRMARDLGLELVAEGVETASQAADLRRLGCDILQGYHFAPPLPLESLLSYLQRPLPSA